MSKETLNITASLQARLRNRAREIDKTFQEVLQNYGIERFLYRLSKTKNSNYFVLKGGLMFYGLDLPLRRPTKDIDFLSHASNITKDISQVIIDTLSMSVPNDGVMFDIKTLRIIETQIDANRHGIRAKFIGSLGKMKIPMQVDIGFSDEISSPPIKIVYPTLLQGLGKPQLKGYPPEAIISEKFHAMIRFGELNSRWKDYFDIWLLSDTLEFECEKLQKAIKKTFERRSTLLPSTRPSSLTTHFASINDKNWKIFLRRSKLQNEYTNEFEIIVEMIWHFLEIPLERLWTHTKVPKMHWIPKKGWV
jgi:predicted nucleotidyltransferase component of viral defense system